MFNKNYSCYDFVRNIKKIYVLSLFYFWYFLFFLNWIWILHVAHSGLKKFLKSDKT